MALMYQSKERVGSIGGGEGRHVVQAEHDHTRGIYKRSPLASVMDETAQCESVSEHAHICGTTRASMSESQR